MHSAQFAFRTVRRRGGGTERIRPARSERRRRLAFINVKNHPVCTLRKTIAGTVQAGARLRGRPAPSEMLSGGGGGHGRRVAVCIGPAVTASCADGRPPASAPRAPTACAQPASAAGASWGASWGAPDGAPGSVRARVPRARARRNACGPARQPAASGRRGRG